MKYHSLILVFTLLSLVIAKECQNFGSCNDCTLNNCFWCESHDGAVCSGKTDSCWGLLFEDSSVCPGIEEMEKLEWWGQNSFFSRTSTCSSGLTCKDCMIQGTDCVWCAEETPDPICKLEPSSTEHKCKALKTACVLDGVPTNTVPEDSTISLDFDALIFMRGETNLTNIKTSDKFNFKEFTIAGNCEASFDSSVSDKNVVKLEPNPNYDQSCKVTIVGDLKKEYLVLEQIDERIKVVWTVNVDGINDAPEVKEDLSEEESELSSLKEDQSQVVLNACNIFEDVDSGDSLEVSVLSGGGDGIFTSTPVNCDCHASSTCSLILNLVSNANGQNTLSIQAKDNIGETGVAQLEFNVEPVNDKPTANAALVADRTFDEDSSQIFIDLTGVFSDPDLFDSPNPDSLEISIVNKPQIIIDETIDLNGLTFSLEQDAFGNQTVIVQVTDNEGATASIQFELIITPVNDPIEVDVSSLPSFDEDMGSSEPIILSDYFTDIESSFPNEIVCFSTSVNSSVANSTVSGDVLTINFRQEGSTSINVKCFDNSNEGVEGVDKTSATATIQVTTKIVQFDPEVIQELPKDLIANRGQKVVDNLDLNLYFSDPNGQTLTFSASSTTNYTVSISAGLMTVTFTPFAKGEYTIPVTADDSISGSIPASSDLVVYAKVPLTCTFQSDFFFDPVQDYVVDLNKFCDSSETISYEHTNVEPVPSGSTTSLVGSTLTVHAPAKSFGQLDTRVIASDKFAKLSAQTMKFHFGSDIHLTAPQTTIDLQVQRSNVLPFDNPKFLFITPTGLYIDLLDYINYSSESFSSPSEAPLSFSEPDFPKDSPVKVKGTDKPNIFMFEGNLLTKWSLSFKVTITDDSTFQSLTFTFNLNKPSVG